jgi:hypothetical protein
MRAWYLCPYDTVGSGDRLYRRPAMCRYVPTVQPGQLPDWDEAETLGNRCLVRLDGDASLHATVQGDPDFLLLDDTVIPAGKRNTVRTALLNLGFTLEEITATGYTMLGLGQLLTSCASTITPNAQRTGFVVDNALRRGAGKTFSAIRFQEA